MNKDDIYQEAGNEEINTEDCNCEDQVRPVDEGGPENSGNDNMAEKKEDGNDNSANLSEEVALWKDRFVRLSAEFDNYRKRTLKEKMELVSTASEDIIKALLPILDDFDRAVDVFENNGASEAFGEGVVLIINKLRDILRSKGLSEIKAEGEALNTDLHDAIAKVPAGKKERDKIVDVAEKGYMLNNKVIRHSKVIVGE